MISGNIRYHLTWQMMLDIIMCITFLFEENKYPASCFICQTFGGKRHVDNQKVQVTDKIKRYACMHYIMIISYNFHVTGY